MKKQTAEEIYKRIFLDYLTEDNSIEEAIAEFMESNYKLGDVLVYEITELHENLEEERHLLEKELQDEH